MYKSFHILILALVIMVPVFAAGQYNSGYNRTGSGNNINSSSRLGGTSSSRLGSGASLSGGSSSRLGSGSSQLGGSSSRLGSSSSRLDDSSRSSRSRSSSSSRRSTPTSRSGGGSSAPTPPSGGPTATAPKTTPKKPSTTTKTTSAKASQKSVDSFSANMASNFVASVPTACLYFDPMDISLAPTEEFNMKVHFHNTSTDVADSFAFSIEYDKPWLEFVGWDAKGLKELVGEENIKIEAKNEPGILSFSGSLSKPLVERDVDLLDLKFRARDIAGRTSLQFVSNPKNQAAVFFEGRNILGKTSQGFRGILHANVFIAMPDDDVAQTTETLSDIDLATALPSEMPEESASLDGWITERYVPKPDAEVYVRLQGPLFPIVQKDTDFWVDIVLYNDSLVPLESFGVKVEFDPKVLAVVDEDRDNWIMLGINIWDGPFHKNYPFDFHRANIADNRRGTIDYYLSRNTGSWPFPTGIFSRIHFRAKETTDVTLIRLSRGSKSRPDTYVRGAGLDRLESTWGNGIPTHCAVRVIGPKPAKTEVSLSTR